MYHPPRIGYGRAHGSPQNALLAPHPHRALARHANPFMWRLQAHPPFPAVGGGGWWHRAPALAQQLPPASEPPRTEAPVEVWLPTLPKKRDYHRTEPMYLCDRKDLLDHLPNIRHQLTGSALNVEDFIAGSNRTEHTHEALHHIFRSFQLRRTSGLAVDVFERARDLLRSTPRNGVVSFDTAFDVFLGTCAALDSEVGLGCSDDLFSQVEEFALELKTAADFGPWNYHALVEFFEAYSMVFQPSTPRHMDALRELWRCIEIRGKVIVMDHLAWKLDWEPKRSNAHVMYRALCDIDAV